MRRSARLLTHRSHVDDGRCRANGDNGVALSWDWLVKRDGIANVMVSTWAETFRDVPPIQPPNSFTIGDAVSKMGEAVGGAGH